MQSITKQENKNDIVTKYEIELSQMLFKKGFVGKSYVEKYKNLDNITIYKWRELIEERLSPFVKCSILRLKNSKMTTIQNWEKCFENLDYDKNLIKNNLKSYNVRNINKKTPFFLKKLFFYIVLCLLKFLRKPFVENCRKFFPFIFD